ncbi:MAG: RepB family plasmid replication initiator protein, partial [Cetobacterium sp.]
MKNIIVDNYLKINKELIGCSISLKKSSEISFFLEVCRIKQMEVLAKHNCYCNDFDESLSINKSKFSNIFNSSTIRKNDRMLALESDGIFFSKVDMENITIIESISFNANNGNFDVEFNESNFIKYFINCIDDNFIKVPTKMFSGLKSKNSSMILLWILKFQDVKGYKFIKPKDLC